MLLLLLGNYQVLNCVFVCLHTVGGVHPDLDCASTQVGWLVWVVGVYCLVVLDVLRGHDVVVTGNSLVALLVQVEFWSAGSTVAWVGSLVDPDFFGVGWGLALGAGLLIF